LFGPADSFESGWDASQVGPQSWTRARDILFLYPTIHQCLRQSSISTPALHDFRLESTLNIAVKIRLLDALQELSTQLATANLNITLLGSTALLATTSNRESTGFRTLPITGLDLTTPPEHVNQVTDLLHELGWTTAAPTTEPSTTEPTTARSTAVPSTAVVLFRNGDLELLLHETMLRTAPTELSTINELISDIHTGLIDCPTLGATTSVPAPTELLLSIIIDGLLTRPAGSISWILDAHQILTDNSNNLDWNRFIELTTTHELAVPVHATIHLINELREGLIPEMTLQQVTTQR
jgi:hypothetical protein